MTRLSLAGRSHTSLPSCDAGVSPALPQQAGRLHDKAPRRALARLIALALAALLLRLSPAQAATYYWTVPAGQSGDWSDPANWGGNEPTSNDTAYINNGGTATISLTGQTAEYLYLGDATHSGAVNMTAGILSTVEEHLGDDGVGTFTQSGGTNAPYGYLYLGHNSTGNGTYNLGAGTLMYPMAEYVGYDGMGTFVQSGGTNSCPGSAYLGYGSTGAGTYNLSDGKLSVYSDEYVGYNGSGTFTQSGGTHTVAYSHYLELGFNSTASGTYHLDAGTLSVWSEGVGSSGTGTFVQSGGTHSVTASLSVGSGTYTLNAGSLSAAAEYVGYAGAGTLTQSGGANTVQNLLISTTSAGQGVYNLGDTGTLSTTANQYIGESGTGAFFQSGGVNTTSGQFIGENSTGIGTYTLTGGVLSTRWEYLGWYGTGTTTQSGGVNTVSDTLWLGIFSTSKGTYNLNGGTLITPAISKIDGTAAFNFGGGTLQASGTMAVSLPMTLTGTGGNANVDTNGKAVTLSGVLSGVGGLNKLGTNTLTLSGPNTYAGPTTVEAGMLALGASAQNAVFTLGGVDVQGGQLAFLYSGSSPADMIRSILAASDAGGFAVGSAKIYSSTAAANGWALGWTDNGVNAVTVMPAVRGDANLDGKVNVNDLTILLTNFGETGIAWTQGDLNYDGSVNVNDLTLVLTNYNRSLGLSAAGTAAAPEPSALTLLGAGAIGLLGWAWRFRRQRMRR